MYCVCLGLQVGIKLQYTNVKYTSPILEQDHNFWIPLWYFQTLLPTFEVILAIKKTVCKGGTLYPIYKEFEKEKIKLNIIANTIYSKINK